MGGAGALGKDAEQGLGASLPPARASLTFPDLSIYCLYTISSGEENNEKNLNGVPKCFFLSSAYC